MIGIIDYGMGNLRSVQKAVEFLGGSAIISAERKELDKCGRLILPGVGSFAAGMENLERTGLADYVKARAGELPILGICLGMQLLFERSCEYGEHTGLALLRGEVVGMAGRIPPELPIPHIGWNALDIRRPGGILKYVKSGDCVYFVHSYYAEGCEESLTATAEYGLPLAACVSLGNVHGCQFHPEKSGKVGLSILKAFCELR